MTYWYNIVTIQMKYWGHRYYIDTIRMKIYDSPGHRPWPTDAFGYQLCDGPQWASYHEHAHRLPSGNLGDISIDYIGDTGWYWGPSKEEKYSHLGKFWIARFQLMVVFKKWFSFCSTLFFAAGHNIIGKVLSPWGDLPEFWHNSSWNLYLRCSPTSFGSR